MRFFLIITYIGHVGHVLLHRSEHRHLKLVVHVVAVHEVGARGSSHLHFVVVHLQLVGKIVVLASHVFCPVLLVA